jgi:hypothetical protein
MRGSGGVTVDRGMMHDSCRAVLAFFRGICAAAARKQCVRDAACTIFAFIVDNYSGVYADFGLDSHEQFSP